MYTENKFRFTVKEKNSEERTRLKSSLWAQWTDWFQQVLFFYKDSFRCQCSKSMTIVQIYVPFTGHNFTMFNQAGSKTRRLYCGSRHATCLPHVSRQPLQPHARISKTWKPDRISVRIIFPITFAVTIQSRI